MKRGFLAKQRRIRPVGMMWEALEISRSGFDAWCRRPPSRPAQLDARILGTVQASFQISDRPRWRARPVDPGPRSIPTVLDRQFAVTAPNQHWVADFTCL